MHTQPWESAAALSNDLQQQKIATIRFYMLVFFIFTTYIIADYWKIN